MPLEPKSAQFVEALAAAGDPPLHESTPAIARMGDMVAAGLTGRGPEVGSVRNLKLDGKNGRFRVRVLAPAGPSRGVVVYFHGGGWVLGDIDLQYDFVGRDLVNRTRCTVVLVNYRKAPEHPFPTALEDSYAALTWVSESLHKQGPLIVAGDSAGGNIAAVLTRWARDNGGPKIDGQVLVYPVTDCDLDRPSCLDPANQLLIGREAMRWFWDHYLPDEASRSAPDASPLRAANLAGLPSALVYTAEYDPLHDEGVAYAAALRAAGVDVTSEEAAGEMHGFFQMANIFPGYDDGIELVSRYISTFADSFGRQA
ncbi:alpha/beta hydrolase [Amycolatopsis circi]|uniref:alpha/beta hydrolase n=1 Tax=Amycolatopsis circi TaxID=871959 RepID=UPI000E280FFB|nr:alpha/beta hydrolase [Amycolatopsis circi]